MEPVTPPGGFPPAPGPHSGAYTNPGGGYAPPAPSYPPVYAEPPKRQKPLTAIALIIAALLVAGGGTAAALIISGQKKNDKPAAVQQVANPTKTVVRTEKVPAPPQPGPTDSAPQTPTGTPSPSNSQALAAEQALKEHWQAIENNDFSTAYGYLDPSAFPDSNAWISSHEQAGIKSVILHTSPGTVNGDTATVNVSKLVTVEKCGTKYWGSTTYDMVRRNGQWLIEASNFGSSPACV